MGYLTVLLFTGVFVGSVYLQNRTSRFIKTTSFSCEGRPSGYYADVETGCQVYHMCDGLGRQFSYSCPNTTLFQQRMLICDHWYMVNCSRSQSEYHKNLLIGQRDKAFVDDDDESQRTPRPDLLSYEYQQDELNLNTVSNVIGGFQDQVKKSTPEVYFLPSHWSTELSTKVKTTTELPNEKIRTSFRSSTTKRPREELRNRLQPTREDAQVSQTTERFQTTKFIPEDSSIKPPSRLFEPPFETARNNPNIIEKLQSKVLAQTALTLQSLRREQSTTQIPPTTELPKLITTKKELPKLVTTSTELPKLIVLEPPNDLLPPKINYTTPKFNQPEVITPIKTYNFTSKISKDFPSQPVKVKIVNSPKLPANDLLPPVVTSSIPNPNLNQPEVIPSIKNYNFTSKISKDFPPQPVKVKIVDSPKPPANDLVPPVPTTTVNSIVPNRLLPAIDLLPPKDVTKKLINDSVVAPSRIVQEPALVFSRKNFLIPSFNLPLEDKVLDTKLDENHLSSYQVNPTGEVNESNKLSWLNYLSTHDKSSLNSDCPNCDPNLLIPGTCQPCILVKR